MAESKKTFLLGTAVEIISRVNIPTATSATIKIVDQTDTIKVNNVAMTKDADGYYSYVYQSASTDTQGTYVVTISVSYGGYTSVIQDYFDLLEQD